MLGKITQNEPSAWSTGRTWGADWAVEAGRHHCACGVERERGPDVISRKKTLLPRTTSTTEPSYLCNAPIVWSMSKAVVLQLVQDSRVLLGDTLSFLGFEAMNITKNDPVQVVRAWPYIQTLIRERCGGYTFIHNQPRSPRCVIREESELFTYFSSDGSILGVVVALNSRVLGGDCGGY